MSLEEFLQKKKIDILAFKSNSLELFQEFESHFEQMGAKSFDHTKKYLFNKLRKQFPLL